MEGPDGLVCERKPKKTILITGSGKKRDSKEAIVVFAQDSARVEKDGLSSVRGPCVLIPAETTLGSKEMIFKRASLSGVDNKVHDEKTALRDAMFLASKVCEVCGAGFWMRMMSLLYCARR